MKDIMSLKQEISTLNNDELVAIKGGFDDKRRQRPGGGPTTTSPTRIGGTRPPVTVAPAAVAIGK